ncbi:ABC transporter ATP-binding protein [Corynebacterium pygosceleis]|uniref:ABC transporter ATP-binding protein n=1 Tax=Corynebacterium pygosceleis TaxID=2800406 RepID=A0ABT3WW01_9CORY|nr:ABC transporter ATP-binding protein [Corynebacterium pygosceleis]MCK7675328.1 ABC transporter ATP-binding protein [Corynebacterium pygosceleis]MCL0121278.1 ABC transporter ATP-binding protein [Corynebacterium pygosceleis]MCX7445494.1 ABC transporter ATP-binding protein [Corynebacterium pygosceleis]
MTLPTDSAHLDPLNPDPTSVALAWRGVTKRFGDNPAVADLSLDIPHGSFYGIVGPNGAGKTTAITIATGLLRPDTGATWVCGADVWGGGALDAKRAYGLLADGLPTFDRLSGAEYLEYLGRLRGMDPATVAERAHGLLDALDLTAAGEKLIVDYSAGMTKKILLAGALLHRPRILILDEPFEAVDPVSGRVIRSILDAFVRGGGTVVMSSHVMELVEGLCDHVALIADGRVVASGTVDDVRGTGSLGDAFINLVGGGELDEGSLGWLGSATGPERSGAGDDGGDDR